jgi:hypothetical protein
VAWCCGRSITSPAGPASATTPSRTNTQAIAANHASLEGATFTSKRDECGWYIEVLKDARVPDSFLTVLINGRGGILAYVPGL